MTTPRLIFDATLFDELIRELARRGKGRRESGAFLLADHNHPADRVPTPVTAVAYYDDLDPSCLTGAIAFHADGYTALSARCRRDRLRVVGDIHTHPFERVAQSPTDAAHPMLALDGHVALIAPHFAVGVTSADALGVHVREQRRWVSSYGAQAAALVCIRGRYASPLLSRLLTRWKRLWRRA